MQRLELVVSERSSDHGRQGRVGRIHRVDPSTQAGFALGPRGRWNEPRVSNSPRGSTDHDLMTANLASASTVAARPGDEQLMEFEERRTAQRPVCDREVRILSGTHVVEDFEEFR